MSDLVIKFDELAEESRLPVPRFGRLQWIARADSVYGFEGDDNPLTAAILRGKLAALQLYAMQSVDRAVARTVAEDDARREKRGSTPSGVIPGTKSREERDPTGGES